jgi:serine/threonine-protein kinase
VEAAVVTALSKLPADRFATAALFAEALSRPGATTVVTPATRLRAGASRPAGPLGRALAWAPWALALGAAGAALWAWRGRAPRSEASWQYITFGGGLVPTVGAPSLALSPDGASLVVRDNAQNGTLWLKRRSELEAVRIPGTERASRPGFSPDGQWILFFADGRLKKIRPGEGSAVTLADTTDGTLGGAAWLDDGTVVYVGPSLSTMSRVSAGGGPSTVVLAPTKALAGFGLGSLSGLPGARGVVFTVCNSGCVNMSVHVLDLRTKEEHLLLDGVVTASYLPTGHLLIVRRDGSAQAAPFDPAALRITGPAVPVLDGVLTNNGAAFMTWSPSGTLVYVRGTAAGADLEAVRVTREGVVAPIDSAWHGGFNSIGLSPDGRRLAVGVGLASGTLGIWIKQLDRGTFTRLTFGGQDRRPVWAPDGREVAFLRDSLNTTSVFARRVDGSAPERLVARLGAQVQEATYSPDGRWLVLRTDNGGAGAGDILAVRSSGDSAAVPLVESPFTELHPAVSPDGRWLAYTSIESGTNEIYVRPFPATTGARWQVSNGGGTQPRWSSDGRELYFLDGGTRLVAAQVRTAPAFEVTGLRPLFDAGALAVDAFHTSYEALPGGRAFVFLRSRQIGQPASGVTVVQAEHWLDDVRARTAR